MEISKIAKKLKLKNNEFEIYFNKFLKLDAKLKDDLGKLIVITSTNPTPMGEGKTTLLIGLNDAMNYHGKKTIGTLRQPSLGPVFGMKGAATGGGNSRLKDDEFINLHFTGDFHAITTANNLISTIIENEIYFNSSLDIDKNKILWNRCLDLNDRGLRDITIKINEENSYNTFFNITAASDLMALFCLVNNIDDFKKKLEKTIVAYSKKNKPITIADLKIVDAIIELLKQSFKPNIAQTLQSNPVIVHGGPFANIAHGCNSVIATKTALSISDYVLTECGFGSDLGFEKFMNIKMQEMKLMPNLVIICATIKSLKYHGQNNKEQLNAGFNNLLHHVNHVRKYNLEPLVILNKNNVDSKEEIKLFKELCEYHKINYTISNIYNSGPKKDTKKLVDKIIDSIQENPKRKYLYNVNKDSLFEKIDKITKNVYSASEVILSDKVKSILKDKNIQDYYICISKTQYSLSSNPVDLNVPNNIKINIKDYQINHAAKMLILLCENVFRMPGLSKEPRAKNFKW